MALLDIEAIRRAERSGTVASKMRCSKCGGRLVYEELFQRGRVYNVLPDGTIGKRFKYMDYCGDDDASMVYCKSCGDNKVFHLEDNYSRVVVKDEPEEDEEEWL